MTMTLQQIARFVPVHILPPEFYAQEAASPSEAPDPLFMDLSQRDVEERCEAWGLAKGDGRKKNNDGAMGLYVVWNKGRRMTYDIVGIDAKSNRVLTEEGLVYELGEPLPHYAKGNPKIMDQLGFYSK